MNILEKTFRNINDLNLEEVFKKCLFVFDTNTIIDLYRLPASTRNDFLKLLKDPRINSRIYLPFQVYLEFMHNKDKVIGGQRNTFDKLIDIFEQTKAQITESICSYNKPIEDLNLMNRHATIDVSKYQLNSAFEPTLENIDKFIEDVTKLKNNEINSQEGDSLYKELIKIFANKIGDPLSDNDLADIYKDGAERYKENIPPGYADAKNKKLVTGKEQNYSYRYENQKYIREYGDLVVWNELINKSNAEKWKFVVLITNDAKEDWVIKPKQNTKPRYELLNEIYTKCSVLEFFTIYQLHSFLEQGKNIFQDLKIKKESVKNAEELPSIYSQNNSDLQEESFEPERSEPDLLKLFRSSIPRAGYRQKFIYTSFRLSSNLYPAVKTYEQLIYQILNLWFKELFETSPDNSIRAQITESGEFISFNFIGLNLRIVNGDDVLHFFSKLEKKVQFIASSYRIRIHDHQFFYADLAGVPPSFVQILFPRLIFEELSEYTGDKTFYNIVI